MALSESGKWSRWTALLGPERAIEPSRSSLSNKHMCAIDWINRFTEPSGAGLSMCAMVPVCYYSEGPRHGELAGVLTGVNLAKLLGGPDSEHLGLGYNHAHSQRPCRGGHGRGVDWIRSQTLSRLSRVHGMKVIGYEKDEFSEIC